VQVKELDLGYNKGRDRLLLRLPLTVRHLVDAESPISRWQAGPSGIAEDADSEIIVIVGAPNPPSPQCRCLLLTWFAGALCLGGFELQGRMCWGGGGLKVCRGMSSWEILDRKTGILLIFSEAPKRGGG